MAEPLLPTDIVPAFRADLKLGEPIKGAGENQILVSDPASGKSMMMRGFELSLARMLNGQRSAGAVVDAAKAIGLPVTLDALTRFVNRLRAHGFLVNPSDAPVGETTTWNQRRAWDDNVRSRYQVALKEVRSDQLNEAKQHLEELLKDAPENTSVQQLSAWVDDKIKMPEADASGRFADLFSSVEKSWFAEGEQQSAENEQAHVEVAQEQAEAAAAELAAMPAEIPEARAAIVEPEPPARAPSPVLLLPKRRSRWGLVVVLFLLLAAGAALAIPFSNPVKGTFHLEPRATTPVVAARAGTVGALSAAEGQWVESGATLFAYDTRAAQQQLADGEKRIADVQRKLDALAKALGEAGKKRDAAHAARDAAEAELKKAKAAGNKRALPKLTAKVKKAETAVHDADAAADKALAAAEKASGASQKDLEAQLAAATADRDAAKALAELPPQTAPAAGAVAHLQVKTGDAVKAGAPVCNLDDTKVLAVKISVAPGEPIAAGQTATLVIDGKDVPVKIDSAEHDEGRGTLDNASGALHAGATGELRIEGRKTSMLGRWF